MLRQQLAAVNLDAAYELFINIGYDKWSHALEKGIKLYERNGSNGVESEMSRLKRTGVRHNDPYNGVLCFMLLFSRIFVENREETKVDLIKCEEIRQIKQEQFVSRQHIESILSMGSVNANFVSN